MSDFKIDAKPPIYKLAHRLFPITRSITGDGVRKSLNIIKEVLPGLKITEVPTGTTVFDWSVPKEWNIRDAYIKDSKGNRVVDFNESNLHLVGYSIPVHKKMPLRELKEHIHTIPGQPDWIPYMTSYYEREWGFCMTHNNFKNLKDDVYEVCIDSSLEDGSLTYGEFYKAGRSNEEFLLSSYICHPSIANDSLSGVALLTYLARELAKMDTYYSYRFLIIPETIGAITWLAKNKSRTDRIKYGLVATCVGDSGAFTYKKSRRGNAEIDLITQYVLDNVAEKHNIEDFFPLGSDERQFCSPAFNLPVGSLMRTRYHKFDEYHTSADNLDFINRQSLQESFDMYAKIIEYAESNHCYRSTNPACEPNLGKRGLFKKARILSEYPDIQEAYFWMLNYSDGDHSLLDIAQKSDIHFDTIKIAAGNLYEAGLLQVSGKDKVYEQGAAVKQVKNGEN